MKKIHRIVAYLLCVILLFTAGCSKPVELPEKPTADVETVPVETTEPILGDTSLVSLRQAMEGTPQLFAVAYFGYHETLDSPLPVDPFAVMQSYTPKLCADFPFLLEIPEDRIIGETGELYCIVPLDENATVAVSRGYWDYENYQHIYDDMLYSSDAGEPILLFCNNAGWEPDTQVYISGPSGEVYWYPQIDDNLCVMVQPDENGDNQFFDFSSYREILMKNHRLMKDSEWVIPTAETLAGTTWSWNGYLKDYREYRYSVTFGEDTLSVRWNDGFDEEDHVFPDAAWELSYEEGFAILEIDFREMAGVLRYNLLYHHAYQQMYVAVDSVQEDIPIGREPLYRYLSAVPQPTEMIGTWEKLFGEIEGETIEAEPGSCTIEIRSAASAGLLMSYTSRDFPKDDFDNELLTIDYRAMYHDCDNSAWVADVDYVGPWDTTYTVTLTGDDILIKQNYYLLDGAPTVSYEYFRRIGEHNEEDPYAYAISQGWQIPELWELAETFWLSDCGYGLELMDDGVPGDNSGSARLYQLGEYGEYTLSYKGSWSYEDGMLHLSLVPQFDDGYFVDDSFPVLMLDDQLWIGRNSSGFGLPHFYSDTLADVLVQPE